MMFNWGRRAKRAFPQTPTMTAYHGGKQRIGAHIADVILNVYEDAISDGARIVGYCEPFCGMCGVFRHVPARFDTNIKYLAGDINKSLILMWQKAQRGWKPNASVLNNMNEDLYNKYKHNNQSSALKGFVGHAFGFGGIYFGSFRWKYDQRQFVQKYIDNISSISNELSAVKFKAGDYNQFSSLKNYIIYCDPPYYKTYCKYSSDSNHLLKFDYDMFIKWCIAMAKNNIVIVSSYNKIKSNKFKKIWHDPNSKRTSYRGRTNTYVESLYMVSSN